jgi:hypothetical protein
VMGITRQIWAIQGEPTPDAPGREAEEAAVDVSVGSAAV